MKLLIANSDMDRDIHNLSWDEYINEIRNANYLENSSFIIYDPYNEEGEDSTLAGNDKIFLFIRSGIYNGIAMENHQCGELYIDKYGFPSIDVKTEIGICPTFLPILSLNTLIAYMPHIPWDEFGDHIRLEGDDADMFLRIWQRFLQQNKDIFNSVYREEYPIDTNGRKSSILYMNHEIE